MSAPTINEVLDRHFPPKWKNEGLKERVIEFGEDVYRAAIEEAAKIAENHNPDPLSDQTALKDEIAAEIRKLGQEGRVMAEMKHTPKGYRIEGENKFMLLATGQEVDGDATACEMELWQINTLLVEALEGYTNNFPVSHDGECGIDHPCRLCQLQSKARAALQTDKQGR